MVCHFLHVPLTFKQRMSYQISGNKINSELINQCACTTPFTFLGATLVVYQPHLQKVTVCVSDMDLRLPLLLKFKSEKHNKLQATGKRSARQLHTGLALH